MSRSGGSLTVVWKRAERTTSVEMVVKGIRLIDYPPACIFELRSFLMLLFTVSELALATSMTMLYNLERELKNSV